jgi:hypothetical protein
LVAATPVSIVSTGVFSAKAVGLNVAGSAGGVLQMRAVAPRVDDRRDEELPERRVDRVVAGVEREARREDPAARVGRR